MMTGPHSQRDIQDRAFRFACSIVSFCQELRRVERVPWSVLNQLLRAATSVGANLEEAVVAISRKDFIAACVVALKEAREALYWLRLLEACGLAPGSQLEPLLAEANALVAILTVIVRRARSNLAANTPR